jgi:hypothetical protein
MRHDWRHRCACPQTDPGLKLVRHLKPPQRRHLIALTCATLSSSSSVAGVASSSKYQVIVNDAAITRLTDGPQ